MRSGGKPGNVVDRLHLAHVGGTSAEHLGPRRDGSWLSIRTLAPRLRGSSEEELAAKGGLMSLDERAGVSEEEDEASDTMD